MRRKALKASMAVTAAIAGMLLSTAAFAGPPLLCWPYEIGGAPSLPMAGNDWHDIKRDIPVQRIESETLALLTPQTPVLVRMETLRRAAVYFSRDVQASEALLKRIQADASARGDQGALATFDAGYLIETYKQTDWGWKPGNPIAALDGYSMVVKAIAAKGNDPEMQFAAAMMTGKHGPPRYISAQLPHVQAALAGATEGSLLAKNLVTHAFLLGLKGSTLAELRASAAGDSR